MSKTGGKHFTVSDAGTIRVNAKALLADPKVRAEVEKMRGLLPQRNQRQLFLEWAEKNLGRGYSLETDEGTFIDPVTRWAEIGFRAGMGRAKR